MFKADSKAVVEAVTMGLQDILSAYATPGRGDVLTFGLRVGDTHAERSFQHSWLLQIIERHFGVEQYDSDGDPVPNFQQTDPRLRTH